MANLHHAVKLQGISGLAEDVFINNFYSSGPGLAAAESSLAQANLIDFFNVATAEFPTDELADFISAEVSRAALECEVRTWEVTLATGVETFVSALPFTLGARRTGNSFPSEVAVVLSFHGIQDGSALDNNRRGRVYIGPLDQAAGDVGLHPVRPTAGANGFPAILANNANRLIADFQADSMDWSVYSRATAAMYPIDSGYVDNAFDTQRRRGVSPTLRTAFP